MIKNLCLIATAAMISVGLASCKQEQRFDREAAVARVEGYPTYLLVNHDGRLLVRGSTQQLGVILDTARAIAR